MGGGEEDIYIHISVYLELVPISKMSCAFLSCALKVLAAILLLGQISFKPSGNGAQFDGALPPQLSSLLGVDPKTIEDALVHNTVVVNRQPVASQLNASQALASRDSLAKVSGDRAREYPLIK